VGTGGWLFFGVFVCLQGVFCPAGIAAKVIDAAMNMVNLAAASAFVQVIDILRHQGKGRHSRFQLRQRSMTGVGRGRFDRAQPIHIST
jgi:hypothetical protein